MKAFKQTIEIMEKLQDLKAWLQANEETLFCKKLMGINKNEAFCNELDFAIQVTKNYKEETKLRKLQREQLQMEALASQTRDEKATVFFRIVEAITGITREEMEGKNRKREKVNARKLLAHFMYEFTRGLKKQDPEKFSFVVIAAYQGNRNHATIINQIKELANHIETDTIMRAQFEACRRMVDASFGRPRKESAA